MDFSELHVGFAPMISNSFKHPFDLRNFVYYARKRDIKFEIAQPNKDYDVIVISPRADISIWSRFRGKGKIIFFIVDSYLAVSGFNIKNSLRGLAKYIGREHKHLRLNYTKAIEEMCSRSDAVVCTTLEQKKDIQEYCKNVHIILEFNLRVARELKTDYSLGDRINLVWEGQPENIYGFMHIKDVLAELKKKYPIALHLITDLERWKYMNMFWKVPILDEIKSIFGDDFLSNTSRGRNSSVYLYQWNLEMLSRIITGCDIAVIPLDKRNPLARGKPENKLVLFWRMGMPTIVSSTAAYDRVMLRSGLNMSCRDNSEWKSKLKKLIEDSEFRKEEGIQGKAFVDTFYSEDEYLKQWDCLFQSVLDR